MIEDVLYNYLKDRIVDGRIYPDVLPEVEIYPSITYQLVSDDSLHTLNKSIAMVDKTYLFSVWGASRKETRQIGQQLITLLDNYQGDIEGMYIDSIVKVSETDIFDDGIYGKKIEFTISFKA